MANANYARFNKRVHEIERRHDRLASGYVRLEERDGILIPVGARAPRRRGLPLRGISLVLGAFLVFKAFLYTYLGAGIYLDRVALLESGSIVEKAGAWIMAVDPITLWIAGQFNGLI